MCLFTSLSDVFICLMLCLPTSPGLINAKQYEILSFFPLKCSSLLVTVGYRIQPDLFLLFFFFFSTLKDRKSVLLLVGDS